MNTTAPAKAIRVILEPKIDSHLPELYTADEFTDYVENWNAVDDKALARYEEEGFLVVRGGLNAAEVAQAKAELEKMAYADNPRCAQIFYEGSIRDHITVSPQARNNSTGTDTASLALGAIDSQLPAVEAGLRAKLVRKFQGFVEQHPPLETTALKPEMIAVLERIAGEKVKLFQDMAMIKPAGGREKPWHQDHAYFNFPLDTKIVGVWIALGRVTPENGCMFVIAGGHHTGPRLHFRRRDWQLCDADVVPERKMALPMEAGDVMIFSAKLPHGTPTNRTEDHRWALQYHYVPVSAIPTDDSVRLAAFGSEGKDVTC